MKKVTLMMMALAISCAACSNDDNHRERDKSKITCQHEGQTYTVFGKCEGNTAKYCDEDTGEYTEKRCSDDKPFCGKFTYHNDTYYGCVEEAPLGQCKGTDGKTYDVFGKCDGNTAKYCNDETGAYTEEDCSKNREKPVCGTFTHENDTYYGCVEKSSEPPLGDGQCKGTDGKTYNVFGVCEKNVAKYCDNGQYKEDDCSKMSETPVCGEFVNQDGKFYGCIASAEPAGCGDVTDDGICAGNRTLQYCNQGKLVTETCDYICAITYDNDDLQTSPYANCYDRCGTIGESGKCFDDNKNLKFCGYAFDVDGQRVDVLVTKDCIEDQKTCGDSGNGYMVCQ